NPPEKFSLRLCQTDKTILLYARVHSHARFSEMNHSPRSMITSCSSNTSLLLHCHVLDPHPDHDRAPSAVEFQYTKRARIILGITARTEVPTQVQLNYRVLVLCPPVSLSGETCNLKIHVNLAF
ncbi:unnamed protein product, partial [Rhizoctonia solani]